ncbi:MAG TPA: YihY/virulence factor BrkB family protein [Streptosporangiaceae bacterium]
MANVIYRAPEGRPALKALWTRLGTTLAIMILLVAAALIVVVTGSLASRVGQALGVGHAAVTAWGIAKWPVLLILVVVTLAVLYWASPNVRQGFRLLTLGSGLAVLIWLAASGLFAVYVANFGHYNKIYGSIAGVIILMIWLWITNLAVLLGAEFDAELERDRAAEAGNGPRAELRDTRKLRLAPARWAWLTAERREVARLLRPQLPAERSFKLGLAHAGAPLDVALARLRVQLVLRRAGGSRMGPQSAAPARGHVASGGLARRPGLACPGALLVHRAGCDLPCALRALTALLRALLDVLVLPFPLRR